MASSLAGRLHSDSGAGQRRLDRPVDLRACEASLDALDAVLGGILSY